MLFFRRIFPMGLVDFWTLLKLFVFLFVLLVALIHVVGIGIYAYFVYLFWQAVILNLINLSKFLVKKLIEFLVNLINFIKELLKRFLPEHIRSKLEEFLKRLEKLLEQLKKKWPDENKLNFNSIFILAFVATLMCILVATHFDVATHFLFVLFRGEAS